MNIPNISTFRFLAPAAALCLMGILAGCNIAQPAQDDPTRYFVLSDPVGPAKEGAVAPGAARIGLKAVKIEGYLKRREIVVRTGENEVEFRDYRRWAEPLEAALSRVLRARLLSSADVAQVSVEPFPTDQDRDFDVSVEVRRCEGLAPRSGKTGASFVAIFEISTTGPNPRVVERKTFVAPDSAWDGTDYDRLANLLTADASALGQEILAALPPKA